jgi:LDH2 family malate/lactate/ureidoglycolate dehydrogenase
MWVQFDGGDPASYMIQPDPMVETSKLPDDAIRVSPEAAKRFASALFHATGVPVPESGLVAEVLVSADLRGIRSHGVARLPYFLTRLESGAIAPDPEMPFEQRTPTTGTLDAGNGIGIVAADRGMTEAMRMALDKGSGFVAIKDSSHFGYAGFWAERAMRSGLIGISMSNSGRRVAPTFGVDSVLGTNPLAVTLPGSEGETDFYLDMATSTVAVGKVETAVREGRALPPGWVASTRTPELDSNGVLSFDSPLLPLGGEGTEGGGHKGYGLGLMVELLCGALGGTGFEARMAGADGSAPPAMGHLMGALNIEGFRPLAEFQTDMATTFDLIRASSRAPDQDRIFIHGELETLAETTNSREGIAVTQVVLGQLEAWGERLGVETGLV